MGKMDFLIIILGLATGLIFFGIFLPVRDQIEENKELLGLTKGLVTEFKAREQRQKEIKAELEELERELKELGEKFLQNPEGMQKFKNYLAQRAKEREVTKKELKLDRSGENVLLKGKWKGNFSELLVFLQDLDTSPYFFELLQVLFQAEKELVLEVTGEIPLIKGGELNEF